MSASITALLTLSLHDALPISSASDGDYPSIYVNQSLTFNPGGSPTQHILIPTLIEAGNPSEPNQTLDRKSTSMNSSHIGTSYAVFCLTNNGTITPPSFSISNA